MKPQSDPKAQSAEAQFRLASVWKTRGNLQAARSGFERVLRLNSEHAPACVKLAEVMLAQGELQDAVRYCDKALKLEPNNADVLFRRNYIKDLIGNCGSRGHHSRTAKKIDLPENPEGKINLSYQKTFRCHRSGWNYVLKVLAPLHNRHGVQFDGFLENNFAWKHWQPGKRPPQILKRLQDAGTFEQLATSEERGITPYRRPWTGCLHNPQGMPDWFHHQESPQTIFAKDIWKRSLEHCKGLFTFSDYHADWLRDQTGKPVSVLVHPTEIPDLQFDFERFLANSRKKVVQIGWWLRRLSAIYQLPLAGNNPLKYQKVRLVPMFFDNADAYLRGLLAKEIDILGLDIPAAFVENTREETHLSDGEYDELLCQNLAFVYLYDANANNVVIECIARATPLLVNPLPAVVEYLGDDYPFYFSTLSEAADKALDVTLIEKTHNYLKLCPTRARLRGGHFLRSFENSEVYQAL